MARATFINAILSGKLDGTVYARNKGGAYVRNWVKPTNPKTTVQSKVRSAFSDSAKAFGGLDTDVKNSWNYYATSYFKPKKIKPGVVYSGFNAFQSLQNTQQQAYRNYRDASVTFPSDIVVTNENITVNQTIPYNVFGGQPENNLHEPIPVTLKSATIAIDGDVVFRVKLGRPLDSHGIEFSNVNGDRKIGFILFGNVPNSTSPTENICLGFTGLLDVTTQSAGTDDYLEFEMAGSMPDFTGRKMWYQTGQRAIVSAYAISNYGELSYIGNVSTTVS